MWETPYGYIQFSYWGGERSTQDPITNAPSSDDTDFAARVELVPYLPNAECSITLDFTPQLDPKIRLSCQKMISGSSAVFEVVQSGRIEKLNEMLSKGTARLSDRDHVGRSLLNVSYLSELTSPLSFVWAIS
jgi:hypothetical protein